VGNTCENTSIDDLHDSETEAEQVRATLLHQHPPPFASAPINQQSRSRSQEGQRESQACRQSQKRHVTREGSRVPELSRGARFNTTEDKTVAASLALLC
ncbi:hypothetical protein BgiBS90_034327, partial [Biomphalaria glabrata]